jgi:hypothetical protein
MSAFNGSGTFVISGVGLPFVTGTTISSTVANQLNTDLATGLSTCITKDGQTTPTNNIPMGNFKLTGVGAPTAPGDALSYGNGASTSTLKVPTRTLLTAAGSGTYNTPANCRQLRVRMCAAGGGGSGWNGASLGSAGGTTIFGTTTCGGGQGGFPGGASQGAGGAGGSGGALGTAVGLFRVQGQSGQSGFMNCGGAGQGAEASGGMPGLAFGYGAQSGGGPNWGGGGRGAMGFSASAGGVAAAGGGGGGGGGEGVDFIINTPAATYPWTVGAFGAGSTGGSTNGTNGDRGMIIVDEFY